MESAKKKAIDKKAHHEQQEFCHTRPAYRQGRKLTAVKVYTINDESAHLLLSGVPSLKADKDLKNKLLHYGPLKVFHVVKDYPDEAFTETYHAHFARIQGARIAKRFLDGYNFMGGLLHVCYAPELETVEETRQKLHHRMKDVPIRIKRHKNDPTNPELDPCKPEEFEEDEPVKRKKKRVTDLVASVSKRRT